MVVGIVPMRKEIIFLLREELFRSEEVRDYSGAIYVENSQIFMREVEDVVVVSSNGIVIVTEESLVNYKIKIISVISFLIDFYEQDEA